MSTVFRPHPNNVSSTLASDYVAGSGSLVLAAGTGALFGSTFPMMVTVITAESYGATGEVNTIFNATGRNGDTLTVSGPAEGTTDRNYAAGARVECRWTNGLARAIETAVNTLENTSVSTASTYIDPPWITSLAGSKVAGNIAGSAASITGSITTSQISNLSSWPGSSSIVTLGTVSTGTWQGAVISKTYLDATLINSSGSYADPAWITSLAGSKVTGNIAGSAASITGSITTSQISNLSSWAGSTAITTLGTVATGTWQGAVIAPAKLGTGTPGGTNWLRGDGNWSATYGNNAPTISGNNTITGAQTAYLCNATSGSIVITLPLISSVAGAEYIFIRVEATANTVTIQRQGTDTFLGGATSIVLPSGIGKFIRLIPFVAGWFTVGGN